ncbi:ABC transporter substrate-binding protein [Pseudogulbenkiania ferrooxidans]|uniref:ABC transporter substrate-binding protein n=1 Tax=Pseudogulbenkiania ferrooxidans EGD-HP2 TaxID=1388764 RepID=A0ABN0NAD0_9NEIS|nr:ABC transporter substrate-binding protein [Pseudogulbenkiania ferrooxidans]ERE17871.1 ABC transporter substrate-binding protein [Pseudogulbenkiania ferrooxidans EGD-HP2]
MKKALITSAGLALLASLSAQAETLRIGVDLNSPPFSKQGADGKPQGFDIDIANSLCAAMKVTCQIVPQDWDGLIPALNANKFDAIISSMQITPERQKAVDFSHKYYNIASRMVAKDGTKVDAASLKGKKIGVLRASTQEKFAKDNWGKNGASIVSYAKSPESFLDLKSGRVDAVFVDSAVGEQEFLKTAQAKGYAFVGPNYSDVKYFGPGCGIAVKKGNKALVERLNKAIDQIRKDGAYKKVQDKYFSFDIYGG